MRPVNLSPGDAPVVVQGDGKPNVGMIGGAIASVLVVAGVAGFFAFSHVDSIKSEAQDSRDKAAEATAEAARVRIQIDSLGKPVVDSDRQLAQGQEAIVVAAYTERHDFVQLAEELRGIMQNTGGWYENVEAGVAAGSATQNVTITGFMPTNVLAASFDERVTATRSLENAELQSLETVDMVKRGSKAGRMNTYWKFTIVADFIDTKAPFMAGAEGSAGADGTTVGDGGSGASDKIELSLEAKPQPKAKATAAAAAAAGTAAKPAEPAKPRNPFDVAASTASNGGV